MESYITFNIDNQIMGIDMLCVEKVIRLPKVIAIPNSVEYLEGVIDFQKAILPVINLKKKLNLEKCDVTPDSSVIIITNTNGKSGIIVDSVNDIISLDVIDLAKIPSSRYINGIVNINGSIVSLLDTHSIIMDSTLS